MTGVICALAGGGGFSVSLSSPTATGISGFATVVSSSVTASATPADAYTFLWSYVSGDVLTITNASAATTTFSASMGSGETRAANYRCAVTNGSGLTRYTGNVAVTLERT